MHVHVLLHAHLVTVTCSRSLSNSLAHWAAWLAGRAWQAGRQAAATCTCTCSQPASGWPCQPVPSSKPARQPARQPGSTRLTEYHAAGASQQTARETQIEPRKLGAVVVVATSKCYKTALVAESRSTSSELRMSLRPRTQPATNSHHITV